MGSIPLVALMGTPTPNPAAELGEGVKVADMMKAAPLNQQILQNQAQSGQLENQQRQAALKSQQGMARALTESGGDLEKAVSLMPGYGVLPQDQMAAQQHILNIKQGAAKLETEKIENMIKHGDRMAGRLDTVIGAKEEDQPALYTLNRNAAIREGDIPDPSMVPEQFPGKDALIVMKNEVLGHNKLFQEHIEQQKADTEKTTAQAKVTEAQNSATKLQAELPGGAMENPEQKYIRLQAAAKQGDLSAQDQAWVAGYEKNKKLVPIANFNLQNAGFGGNDPNYQNLVSAVANGQMKIENVVTPRTPLAKRTQFLADVLAQNPQFNAGDFDIEKGVRKKFTSGNVSDQLMAINTAREHIKVLNNLADALDNGDIPALNKIGNTLGVEFGSDKSTNFAIASHAVGSEIARAFDGAGVTQGERKDAQEQINANMSKGQFRGAIKVADALLSGKQKSAKQSYDTGTKGQPNFGGTQASPQGGGQSQGGSIQVKAPNGKTYTFPDQASADKFKQAANIQ